MIALLITIAISLLFGLAAFAALLTIGVSTLRGMKRGQEILAELAELDTRTGRAINQSGRVRPNPFSTAQRLSGARA